MVGFMRNGRGRSSDRPEKVFRPSRKGVPSLTQLCGRDRLKTVPYRPNAVEVAALLHGDETEAVVLLFIVFVCIVLWLLGVLTATTLGGVLHVLLVIAIVLFLVHIIQGSSIGNA